jgi:hypothetical protein
MKGRNNMTKISKIGLSALCGSLACVAGANAGDITVTGTTTATYMSKKGSTTGNPLGLNTGLTFSGAGELDGGQSFALTITHADQNAFSAASLSLTTNNFGTVSVALADGGNGIDGYDDKMPSAWEETWGTGVGTGIDLISGVGASTNFGWKSPTIAGITLNYAYAGKNDGVQNSDKSTSGSSGSANQEGYDLLININPSFGTEALSGLNVFVGASETKREVYSNQMAGNNHQEGVAGITYAIGPVSLGYQRTGEFGGDPAVDALDYYDNRSYGVAFNINDSLSISYGELESTKKITGSTKVTTTAESLQVAYTLGGAAFKFADTDVSNASYSTAASSDVEGKTFAVSLAF